MQLQLEFVVRKPDAVVEMGKGDNHQLPVTQQSHGATADASRSCQRCSMAVCAHLNLKCAVVLIFSVAVFLSAILFVFPVHYGQPGFDAKDSIKFRASVQAYFKLQKQVLELVPYVARLEYDVNGEIGVPSMKVDVLSMHPAKLSNLTDVVFGFLPDPITSKINPVSLSVLKSSLIDLFLRESNLTLTSSIFGEPTSFEILKIPDGITINPEPAAFILQIPQPLFNFTLNSTIYDIKTNLPQLKEQLKLGLHLMANEVLYIQVTNKHGSTKDPPVTVEASVASELGLMLPDRLRQLAQAITSSRLTENLGLDHSVFGKVKGIRLSSFLKQSLHAPAPTTSPCPAPSEQIYDYAPSPTPAYPPAVSPSGARGPCPPSSQKPPNYSLPPISNSPSPSPSVAHRTPHRGSIDSPSPSPTSHSDKKNSTVPPLVASSPQIPSNLSPLPGVAYHSRSPDEKVGNNSMSPPYIMSSSSRFSCTWRIRWPIVTSLLTFLLLFRIPLILPAT